MLKYVGFKIFWIPKVLDLLGIQEWDILISSLENVSVDIICDMPLDLGSFVKFPTGFQESEIKSQLWIFLIGYDAPSMLHLFQRSGEGAFADGQEYVLSLKINKQRGAVFQK